MFLINIYPSPLIYTFLGFLEDSPLGPIFVECFTFPCVRVFKLSLHSPSRVCCSTTVLGIHYI